MQAASSFRPGVPLLGAALLLAAQPALTGCALRTGSRSPSADASALVDRQLSDAAEAITRDLAILTGSSQGRDRAGEANAANSGSGIGRRVTIRHDGPLEEGLSHLCAQTGYRLVVVGERPDIPVIIHIRRENRPALELFREIGMLTGPGEKVDVLRAQRICELTYLDPRTGRVRGKGQEVK